VSLSSFPFSLCSKSSVCGLPLSRAHLSPPRSHSLPRVPPPLLLFALCPSFCCSPPLPLRLPLCVFSPSVPLPLPPPLPLSLYPSRQFYWTFKSFSSKRSFGFADKYDPRDAQNRLDRRAIDKENEKLRKHHRMEYSAAVRALVRFFVKWCG
jgi:hypothetical protein